MLDYDPETLLPRIPGALVLMCDQRWAAYSESYGHRWRRLYDLGWLPGDFGGELFEIAESTILTYYQDSESELPAGFLDANAIVTDGEHTDWLLLNNYPIAGEGYDSWIEGATNDFSTFPFLEDNEPTVLQWKRSIWQMYLLLAAEGLRRAFGLPLSYLD